MTRHQHEHHTGHQHGHGGGTEDLNWAEEVAGLDRAAAWWRPLDQTIVEWLELAPGSRAADVGCGAGGMAVVLAERVGADGQVCAVDSEPALLQRTRERAEEHGVAAWTRTVEADLGGELAGTAALGEPFDLVWASHVVHHVPDQQAAIGQLAGLVAPGGRLVLAEGGLSRSCLPWDVGVGTPGLEERLTAAESAWFVDMRASMPEVVSAPYGWPVMLANAGLTGITSRSFLVDKPAPLDADSRAFVLSNLTKRVERRGEEWLDDDDRAAWARLLDASDPAWLGHREDLYALEVRTVHVGRRPA